MEQSSNILSQSIVENLPSNKIEDHLYMVLDKKNDLINQLSNQQYINEYVFLNKKIADENEKISKRIVNLEENIKILRANYNITKSNFSEKQKSQITISKPDDPINEDPNDYLQEIKQNIFKNIEFIKLDSVNDRSLDDISKSIIHMLNNLQGSNVSLEKNKILLTLVELILKKN